jgi:hypothetical protein
MWGELERELSDRERQRNRDATEGKERATREERERERESEREKRKSNHHHNNKIVHMVRPPRSVTQKFQGGWIGHENVIFFQQGVNVFTDMQR